ncbi:hypothetical protein F8M41_023543 [Gigaspora margarita]|uniref:Uncharacterized protein n=1 Tax=Gigaspora margarita TaxID=4874 RepID=A0A8H4AD65_GIGMA|nr:hypothetical protein F8M41_023543 [Gigaspora margarita]
MVEFWCGCVPRFPPRYGTIILASVSFFISSWFAAIYLAKPEDYVPDMSRGLTLVFGIAFIIMALVSLFGIIGSLFEIATAVRVFANMLWGFVIVNIIIAIIIIVNLVQNRQYEIDNCVQKQSGDSTNASLQSYTDLCTHRETSLIIRNVAIAILLILFSVLFARVSSVYARKLETRSKHTRRLTPIGIQSVAKLSSTEINTQLI